MIGIITQIYFYSNIIKDIQQNNLKPAEKNEHLDKIIKTYKLSAYMIADDYHPLIDNEVIDLMNKGVQGIEFKALKFIINQLIYLLYLQALFQQYQKELNDSQYKYWFKTFAPGGDVPEAGTIWKSKKHAETLQKIAVQDERIRTLEREMSQVTDPNNGQLKTVERFQAGCPRKQVTALWWAFGVVLVPLGVAFLSMSAKLIWG